MPDQSSRKTTLQTPGYYAQVWMSVMTGSEVLNATVSATPTYPTLNLAITVNSGSAANVKRGMRIVLQSTLGATKGTLIVRSTGTISSTNIPTREFGKGFANVVSGDVLRVYDDFPIADKLVAADETFAPDQLAYSDQNTNPPPVPCSGGSYAGWLSDSSAIPFTGSSSYTLGTGGTITHAWSASGGTLSSAVNADPTFNPVAAGKYLITHTTTDNVNSKARTQYTRVRAHDASDPPIDVLLTQPPSCDEDQGWRCRIRLFDNADLTSLPDYAHVILWTNAQTFGCATPGRHHILIDGYLRRDEQNLNPALNTIEFDVISPLAALAELPGFSKVMVTDASPDAWSEFGAGALDVQRAIIQLPLFYTTLIESGTDFLFPDFDNAEYTAFFLVKDNPLAQMRELAAGRGSRIVCHKNGRFEVQPRLDLQPLATRSVLATTYSIDANDVDAGSDGSDGIVLSREHKRPVETFRARGFTAGSTIAENNPVFAKWPDAPGMGNQSTIQEKLIVDDTAQLFDWVGMMGAAADSVFQNGVLELQHAPSARIPLRGAYWAIFDFFHEWIAFTSDYGTSSNLRGVALSAFRWQFRGLSLDWDEHGLPRAVLELKAETAGEPGIDDTPDQTTLDHGTDPDLTPPLSGETSPIPAWTGVLPTRLTVCSIARPSVELAVGYTVDLGLSTITFTYEDRSGNLAALGVGYCVWAGSNPYHYRVLYVLTDIGLCVCNDITLASPTWTLLKTNAALFGGAGSIGHQVFASHLSNGWGAAVYGGNVLAVTFDGWASSTQVQVGGGAAAGEADCHLLSAWICGHNPYHLYAFTRDTLYGYLWRSTDGGLTWVFKPITSMTGWLITAGAIRSDRGQYAISIPYARVGGANNLDDGNLLIDVIYHHGDASCHFNNSTHYRSTDGGDNFTVISSGAYPNYRPRVCNPIAHFTHDAAEAYIVVEPSTVQIRSTADNFATSVDSGGAFSENETAMNGWSPSPNVAIAFNRHNGGGGQRLFATFDHGTTWLAANLPPDWSGSDEGVAYAQGELYAVAGMPQ